MKTILKNVLLTVHSINVYNAAMTDDQKLVADKMPSSDLLPT